ncbi:hypothetical protein BDZ90DRAFT_257906 [Jaminaea rosea]|uniref:CCHC-type domain-containing protein n=1 Tax=Jaminaea rosea TaxID=1569628 RepID=A0A316V049_9BASI|nr:hypothetical protein BDZ90DRAFT_257906 [Jaminaea rosea]PWN30852.1 hypothetical protein BDZ90DRAFT_257906 [Jaminaea rosea]
MPEASSSKAAATSSSSSSTEAMKILSVGPARGNITGLVSKTAAIQAKHGPFDALFVTGDFFGSDDELNEDEQRLLDGQMTLPMPTYVGYGRARPPKRVRDLVKAEEDAATTSNGDRLPTRLADNLYWLARDQVTWVSKDKADAEAIRRAARARGGDYVVDEDAERRGLRVAVCGGEWNAEAWAKEVQRQPAEKNTDGEEEEESRYILPSTINRLSAHKAFQPISPTPPAPSSSSSVQHQTLAAARAATQALMAAAAAAATPPSRPHVDILLLPSWPSGVSLFSKTFPPAGLTEEARSWGLPCLAELTRRSCPRYVFTPAPMEAGEESDGVFWEREPYTTSMTPAAPQARSAGTGANSAMPRAVTAATDSRTTRFISLAKAANASKVRWFVALNLAFAGSAGAAAPPPKGSTMSPFGPPPMATVNGGKRKADDDDTDQGLDSAVNFRWQQRGGAKKQRGEAHQQRSDDAPPPSGYICRICGSADHYIRLCPHSVQSSSSRSGATSNGLPSKPEGAEAALEPLRRRREPVTMVGPADCWFCLSNPQCAKHLVVSIAEDLYVALPKGQLPPPGPKRVPGGGHVLLVPIAHVATLAGPAENMRKLRDEVESHLASLEGMYAHHGFGLACWSVVKLSNTRAGHLQVQCVPVPAAIQGGEDLLSFVQKAAEERGYDLKEVQPDTTPLPVKPGQEKAKRRLAAHATGEEEYFEMHISLPPPTSSSSSAPQSATFLMDLSPSAPGASGGRGPRFDYQFARTTLAQYLGVPERADWRACTGGGEEEEAEQTKEVRRLWSEWGPEEEEEDDDDEE